MKILAIDIGGTFIKYALMDETAAVLSKGKEPTVPSREGELETIGCIFAANRADCVALSMPGIIDAEKGYCIMGGGALPYNTGFAAGDAVSSVCGGVPVFVENDAKCAAIAEAKEGSLQGASSGFAIIIGTMVGGGYVINGKLQKGAHFSAGEISYIMVDRNGYPNAGSVFGKTCSVNSLCRLFAELKGRLSATGEDVFDAVDAGDPDGMKALDAYAYEIAVQIFSLQNILDPERFAIGGGISRRPELIESIRRALNRIYENCPYPVPHAEVVQCRYFNDANLMGAFCCAREGLEKQAGNFEKSF